MTKTEIVEAIKASPVRGEMPPEVRRALALRKQQH